MPVSEQGLTCSRPIVMVLQTGRHHSRPGGRWEVRRGERVESPFSLPCSHLALLALMPAMMVPMPKKKKFSSPHTRPHQRSGMMGTLMPHVSRFKSSKKPMPTRTRPCVIRAFASAINLPISTRNLRHVKHCQTRHPTRARKTISSIHY